MSQPPPSHQAIWSYLKLLPLLCLRRTILYPVSSVQPIEHLSSPSQCHVLGQIAATASLPASLALVTPIQPILRMLAESFLQKHKYELQLPLLKPSVISPPSGEVQIP